MNLIEEIQSILQLKTEYDASSVSEGMPVGREIDEGLQFLKKIADDEGFVTKTFDGHALAICYGDQSERIEAVSHIDVVPASDGWSIPPYEGRLIGNRLYGRGSQDMKTALWLSYAALREIKRANLKLKRQLRVVVGTDEERTMEDIVHYLEAEGLPEFAFTPDSAFPICLGEKGAVSLSLQSLVDSRIISLSAGTVPNVVCDRVVVRLSEQDALILYEEAVRQDKSVEIQADTLTFHGKSVHTSMPEKGNNAINRFLEVYIACFDEDWAIQLKEAFNDYRGEALGLKSFYDPMGPLSVCLNVLKIVEGRLSGEVDIRFPMPLTSHEIIDIFTARLSLFEIEISYQEEAIEASIDNPYIQICLSAFHNAYPDDRSKPFYSGGVTYAKKYQGKAAAYGIHFQESALPKLAHQLDEYIEVDEFSRLVELFKTVLIECANA